MGGAGQVGRVGGGGVDAIRAVLFGRRCRCRGFLETAKVPGYHEGWVTDYSRVRSSKWSSQIGRSPLLWLIIVRAWDAEADAVFTGLPGIVGVFTRAAHLASAAGIAAYRKTGEQGTGEDEDEKDELCDCLLFDEDRWGSSARCRRRKGIEEEDMAGRCTAIILSGAKRTLAGPGRGNAGKDDRARGERRRKLG